MKIFSALGAALWAWEGSVSALSRPGTWMPLVVLMILRSVALLVLVFFFRPGVIAVAEPVVRFLGGEAATHYPEHLYRLPDLLRGADALILPLFGSVAWAVTVRRLALFLSGSSAAVPRFSFDKQGASAFIVVGGLVLVEWGLLGLFSLVPDEIRATSSLVRLALLAAQWGLISAVIYFAIHALPSIAIQGRSWIGSLRESFRMRAEIPLTTAVLVLLPMGLRFPFFVAGQIDLDERGVSPEGMIYLVGAQLLLETLCTYVLLASVTRVFLWRRSSDS